MAEENHRGTGSMGPGSAQPALDRAARGASEWRYARHCRQPRVPGYREWRVPRLCGGHRQTTVELWHADGCGRRTCHLLGERQTICGGRAGWGTLWDLYSGILSTKSGRIPNVSRLLVFGLDGEAELPPVTPHALAVLDPPPVTGEAKQLADGAVSFSYNCSGCHGDAAIAGVLIPDLRLSPTLNNPQLWQQIVHDGILKDRGMVAWSANMTPAQIENIRLYIIKRTMRTGRWKSPRQKRADR